MKIYCHDIKRWVDNDNFYYGIVYMDESYIEHGFFKLSVDCVPINLLRPFESVIYVMNADVIKVPIQWCDLRAAYVSDGRGRRGIYARQFNYPLNKKYNLCKLNITSRFHERAIDADLEHLSQFTFGFEHETCAGNIPWLECLNSDLIPLYDGSISGHEYVSLPLTHETIIPALVKHLTLLSRHTQFNKNCSLHIHFGNFPIRKENIMRLTKYWSSFQYDLLQYLPVWSYQVERYKDNHKAYNQPLNIRNFDFWIEKATGNVYENDRSFYLPNQNDVEEVAKWNVKGRYFNLNIMHLISGEAHKTVEFRFLRPTHNLFEIKWYLLVFGAFLRFVIEKPNHRGSVTVTNVLSTIFPKDMASKLLSAGDILRHLSKAQCNIDDRGGIDDWFKQNYLKHFNFQF